MKVLELLKRFAANAKIIKIIEEARKEEPACIEALTVSLPELIAKKSEEDLAKNFRVPETEIRFDEIFAACKITAPAHGWTVDTVTQFLASEANRKSDRETLKKTLLDTLVSNNSPPQDIIKDAVSRDRTLDAYEQFVYKKVRERTGAMDREISALKEEIEEAKSTIGRLELAKVEEDDIFQQWVAKKVAMEESMANAVSLLTSDGVISVGPTTKTDREDGRRNKGTR